MKKREFKLNKDIEEAVRRVANTVTIVGYILEEVVIKHPLIVARAITRYIEEPDNA